MKSNHKLFLLSLLVFILISSVLVSAEFNEIKYYSGFSSGFGGTPDTVEFAIRLTPTELNPYINYPITNISFAYVDGSISDNISAIRIYGHGSSTSPGSLLYNYETTSSPSYGWNYHIIDESEWVYVEEAKDYWISLVFDKSDSQPLAIDASSLVSGKGAWINYGGSWDEISTYGFNNNFIIVAYILNGDESGNAVLTPEFPVETDILEGFCNITQDIARSVIAYHYTWMKNGMEHSSGEDSVDMFYLDSSETSIGDDWLFSCHLVYDDGNGDEFESNVVTVTDSSVCNPLNPNSFAGSGTSGDPYQISDCCQLQNIDSDISYLNADFILSNDIDCSDTVNWDSGNGFNSIATLGSPFRGTLNANNYSINGLFIDRSGNDYQGLFSSVQNSLINDLELNNFSVTGKNGVGSLSGNSRYSSFENIVVNDAYIRATGWVGGGFISEFVDSEISNSHINDVDIECTGVQCGGFVSKNYDSNITDSSVSGNLNCNHFDCGGFASITRYGGTISGSSANMTINSINNWAGGFVGRMLDSAVSIINCSSHGHIASTGNSIGGFAGYIPGSDTLISGSFSSMEVEGNNYVGGFVGQIDSDPIIINSYSESDVEGVSDVAGFVAYINNVDANISNCYSRGTIVSDTHLGGFVDSHLMGSEVFESFYDLDSSGQFDTNAGSKPKTTIEMNSLFTFSNASWSICSDNSIWKILDGEDYPCLTWEDACSCQIEEEEDPQEPSGDDSLVSSVVIACPWETSTVIVYDDSGDSVNNANIKISSSIETYIGTTNNEGLYYVNLPKGNYSLLIEKAGFDDLSANFELGICSGNNSGNTTALIEEIINGFSQSGSSSTPYIPSGSAGVAPVFKSIPEGGDADALFEEINESKQERTKVLSFTSATAFSLFMLVLIVLLVIIAVYVRHKVRSHRNQ